MIKIPVYLFSADEPSGFLEIEEGAADAMTAACNLDSVNSLDLCPTLIVGEDSTKLVSLRIKWSKSL